MALSAFDDRSSEPTEPELTEILRATAVLWEKLRAEIASSFDPVEEDWTFSGKKWGWALRLKHKRRAILYMTPTEGFFVVGFALGEKAVEAAHSGNLPPGVIEQIDGSQKYAEGRAVRLEVRAPQDVDTVMCIAEIKMSN
jgi:hypothetical protein